MPSGPFSGGEKSRLVLALLVYQRPNLLLLDEPTNHLDLEMRQALALALQDFDGAMVLVSHDRHLLRVTSDRLVMVHDGRVDDFPLSLDEYPRWLTEQGKRDRVAEKESSATNSAAARKEKKRLQAEQRKQLQPLRNKVGAAEAALEKLHARQSELELSLSEPGLYGNENKDQLKALLLEKAEVDSQCESAEMEWLEVYEQLETAQRPLPH
jgi:ATP-binding cassette subfamily F protein 3